MNIELNLESFVDSGTHATSVCTTFKMRGGVTDIICALRPKNSGENTDPPTLPPSQVKQQKVLLERWRDQWNKFSRQLSHFEDWVGRAEELVTMETYGHSLTEMEVHVTAIKVCVVNAEEKRPHLLVDIVFLLLR